MQMRDVECSLGHECRHQAGHGLAIVVGHQLTLGGREVVAGVGAGVDDGGWCGRWCWRWLLE